MEGSASEKSRWYLIIIEDLEDLPGKNICQVIQLLLKFKEIKYVILDYIEGAAHGGLISLLKNKEDTVMNLETLLEILPHIIQFDWGDFYLFKAPPLNWKNLNHMTYADMVIQSDTTIRAVDDHYIYIYTPYIEILNLLENSFKIESIKQDLLENFDYPE